MINHYLKYANMHKITALARKRAQLEVAVSIARLTGYKLSVFKFNKKNTCTI